MKILIADDETLARERLHELVKELYSDADISEATNGLEALDKISSQITDIVLLDIRMPDMDGLEVARHALLIDTPPAIVFTTAYQEHAISAFDANAVDYLLKPIRKDRLKIAIDRARIVNRSRLSALSQSEGVETKRTHISAMVQGNIQLIAIDNIYYLKADQKYVTAAWPGGEILLDEPLVSLESEFSDFFIRIHRNALVAKNHIEGLSKTKDGQTMIKLADMPVELVVSRRHLANVKATINKLGHR